MTGFFEGVLGVGGGLVGGVGGGAGGFVAGGGAGVLTTGGILAPPEAVLGAGVGTYLGAKGGYSLGSAAGRGVDQKLHDWTHAQTQADGLNSGDQGKCANNCAANTPADVLKGAKKDTDKDKLKDGSDQYVKENSNGMPDAQKDFNSLNPQNVKNYPNGTSVGTLSDGTQVVVRPKSVPSLEINPPTGDPSVIRYK